MLVNISYAVDFEEVPDKVREFLENICGGVEGDIVEDIKSAQKALDQENFGKCILTIEEVRQKLIKADMRLRSCSEILKAYQGELINPEIDSGEVYPPQEDMNSLQEKLEKFKNYTNEGCDETTSG